MVDMSERRTRDEGARQVGLPRGLHAAFSQSIGGQARFCMGTGEADEPSKGGTGRDQVQLTARSQSAAVLSRAIIRHTNSLQRWKHGYTYMNSKEREEELTTKRMPILFGRSSLERASSAQTVARKPVLRQACSGRCVSLAPGADQGRHH